MQAELRPKDQSFRDTCRDTKAHQVQGWVKSMPGLHCCAALCAGLPQAVSYRCCSRSLQEVTLCLCHWKQRCTCSYNRENKSLISCFFSLTSNPSASDFLMPSRHQRLLLFYTGHGNGKSCNLCNFSEEENMKEVASCVAGEQWWDICTWCALLRRSVLAAWIEQMFGLLWSLFTFVCKVHQSL